MQVTLNPNNFESEVLNADIPVLVDFWADWCMPCKIVAPVLEELAQEYEGKLKIGKLDVDANADIAAQYNIVSIPTMLFFKGGEVVKQQIGAVPKERLKQSIDELL